MAVHSADRDHRRRSAVTVESGANGVAGNLGVGRRERRDNIPLIGDALSDPLSAAGDAARGIAGAGHNLDTTAGWLAWVLAVAVAAHTDPCGRGALAVSAHPVLPAQMDGDHTGVDTPAGEQLLALRALANRPLRKLAAVSMDPVGALAPRGPHRDQGPGRPRIPLGRHFAPPTSTPPALHHPGDFGAVGCGHRDPGAPNPKGNPRPRARPSNWIVIRRLPATARRSDQRRRGRAAA